MNTGIYYYEKYLSVEERHYFSLNLKKQNDLQEWEYLDKSYEDFSKFLSKAFVWIATPQGHYFWALVETRYKYYQKLSSIIKSVFESEFYDFPDERIKAMMDHAEEYIQENVKPYQELKYL